MMPRNCAGTFILRPSERIANGFSLTVKDSDSVNGPHVRNYRVKTDERGGYFITPMLRYRTVAELIADYRESLRPRC